MNVHHYKINKNFLIFNFLFITLILVFMMIGWSTTTLLPLAIGYIGMESLLHPLYSKKEEVIAPTTLIPFMYMMYALGPLVYRESYPDHIFQEYLLLQLIGLISLKIGLKSVVIENNSSGKIINKVDDISSLRLSVIIFFIIAVFSTLTEIMALGGLQGVISTGYGVDRILVLESSIIIGGGFQWLMLSAGLLWYTGFKLKSYLFKAIGIVTLLFSIIVLFFTGGRSTIVYTSIFLLFLYHYDAKKIKLEKILLYLFFGIILAQLYSNARYYLPEGIESTIKNTTRIFLNDPKSFMPIPENISEFQFPARSLLDILNSDTDFRFYGQTLINALGTPIPFVNRILSNFGVDIADWYLLTFYPDIYVTGAGLGFSPITEGYLNFGYIGVIIHMWVYGWIGGKVYQLHLKNNNMLTLLLLAGLTPILILEGLRIHLSSALYKLFRIYLFPLILYLAVRYILYPIVKKR